MPSVITVLPPPSESHLDESSSSSFGTVSSDAITVVNLLAAATTLATAGQSLKSTEALIAQKQHQISYIQQQQRLQQEKQRQLIYSQKQRHQQYLRCSGQVSFTTSHQQLGGLRVSKRKGKESRTVDLVDDVWRLVFFILACDCKNLGRAMQVNKRFYSLIANDALLWRLTYKLTISGSISAGQKPLLSPSWIREHHLSEQGASGFSFSTHLGQASPISNGALSHTLEKSSDYMSDRNEDGLDSMPSNTDERGWKSGSFGHSGAESSSVLNGPGSSSTESALESFRSRPGSQSTGALLHPNSNASSTHTAVSIAPGLQMPSPLILPHHRRIAQSMTAMNSSSSQPTTTLAQIAGYSQSQTSYLSGTNLTNSSNENLGLTTTSMPASTPATTSMTSFPSTVPSSASQVAVTSSSTTPIRVIQHHIPSTTLMHHSPAVYWKHQVTEWLEKEQLRCLRLGLFWRSTAAASRAHGPKTHLSR